jgi:hypothetical protein
MQVTGIAMNLKRKKLRILLAILVVIATGAICLLYSLGYISHIRVSKTEDGWVCSGPIRYSWLYSGTMPVISGDKVVVVERYKRPFYIEGFKVKPCPRCFQRDAYYITALTLSNGRIVYRTRININKHPLQGCSVSPLRDNVVVGGYIQEEPGANNRMYFVTILDGRGQIVNQFSIPPVSGIRSVDEKNNLLLCHQDVDANDRYTVLDPQILHMLELPSGTEKFQVKIAPFNYLVADKEGNVYINFLNQMSSAWADYMEERTASVNTRIEKYSVLPWQKIWSTAITPERGHSELLKYEDGMLWYSICDENADFGEDEDRVIYPEDIRKWIDNPINCETGKRIETEQECDPYRFVAEYKDEKYIITKADYRLHVTVESRDE